MVREFDMTAQADDRDIVAQAFRVVRRVEVYLNKWLK